MTGPTIRPTAIWKGGARSSDGVQIDRLEDVPAFHNPYYIIQSIKAAHLQIESLVYQYDDRKKLH